MTDAFATLGLPRRAALDEETLQEAYAAHSRAAHPDHGGDERRAAEVNGAYETLRAPDKRLKHLLELNAPDEAKQWRAVPMDEAMMSLFSDLGKALEASGGFLERKSRAQTALARALLSNEEMQHREALERIGFELDHRRTGLEARLPELDSAIEGRSPAAWMQLGRIQAEFAYLAKWHAQVKERLLSLM